MANRTCSAEGCERPRYNSREFCRSHDRKMRLYGDPLAGRRLPGSMAGCVLAGCSRLAVTKDLCEKHYHQTWLWGDPSLGPPAGPRPCVVCGTVFTPQVQRIALYCSKKCSNKVPRESGRRAVAKTNARIAAERLAAKAAVERRCAWCDELMPASMRSDARFCSKRCNQAAHKPAGNFARRHKVGPRKPEMVTLAQIAKRDGWVCGLCGEKVNVKVRYPDLLSPSIDHVVPVSAGGSHEMSNLQLAHFGCNIRKKNRPMGEQLRLI